jgi:hypothetical protein
MLGERATGGVLSLVTFFAQAKKVTRSAAGRVEALHFSAKRAEELDSGFRRNDELMKASEVGNTIPTQPSP